MTGAPPLLVRIALAVTVTVLVAAVRLLLGIGRLGLWLLALAGFRGGRLVALAITGLGVWWAAARVGFRPAVWLVVIGWAAWAVRHHRAAVRQHAAVRKLTAILQRHTDALAAAGRTRLGRVAGTTTRPAHARLASTRGAPADRGGLTVRSWPQAGQPPEQTVAALGRYAAAFVARHSTPADPALWMRRRWRQPR
jgi:hypothetical protein